MIREFSLTIAAVFAVISVWVVLSESLPGAEAAEVSYERFAFTQIQPGPSGGVTRTLVLAHVTPDAIELRDICTGVDTGAPLCVNRGIAYTYGQYGLRAIDFSTGLSTTIAKTIRPYAQVPGRFYSLQRQGEVTAVRVYDLEKRAYRDIMSFSDEYSPRRIAVSPGERYLAFLTLADLPAEDDDGGPLHELTVIDLKNGTLSHPCAPITYWSPSIASRPTDSPPCLWADANTLLTVQSEQGEISFSGQVIPVDAPSGPAGEAEIAVGIPSLINRIIRINVATGDVQEVGPIPANAEFTFARLRTSKPDDLPYMEADRISYYVDVANCDLIEDDHVGGAFRRLRGESGEDDHVFHAEHRLDSACTINKMRVAPDTQRAVWFALDLPEEPYTGFVRYYDCRQGLVRTVVQGHLEWYPVWITEEDLSPDVAPCTLDDGWLPFNDFASEVSPQA